jgi:GTPase
MKPIVAIIGRPNTGKSTFFNRVTRTQNAIVDNMPGVTRDRHYGDAVWDNFHFSLVDTGGFVEGDTDAFAPEIRAQVAQAIEDADAVIFLLDGKNGVSPFDRDLVEILRTSAKPAFYVVNKIDGAEKEAALYDFYALGVETLFPVSAAHGYGVGDLLDTLIEVLPKNTEAVSGADNIKLAIVGRPNAGKSSLINRIIGKNRLVVSDVPGTTRDAIDTACNIEGKAYTLIDTAGIRRKGKVSARLEKFSVIKALRSLDRCDVALVVLDASEGITDQDIHIAGYANDRKCGIVFLLNKWDLIDTDDTPAKYFYDEMNMSAKFAAFAPVMTISAKTGLRVKKIFATINEVHRQYATRIGTGELNRIFEKAVERTPPSLHRGRRIKLYYVSQVTTKPPTFVCFTNSPEGVHFSYQRYLLNQIRTASGLNKTPLRLLLRKRQGDRRKK